MTTRGFTPHLFARAKGYVLLFFATVPMVVSGALSPGSAPQSGSARPSPELKPTEVVRIQVEALRKNGYTNDGIELTYRFASPDNKRYTGPLDRFIDMVRSAPYDRLLNHRRAEYSPIAISGNQAQQLVVIIDADGNETGYVWVLSRQAEGEYKECWMTDAVIPAEREVERQFTQRPMSTQVLFGLPSVSGRSLSRPAYGQGVVGAPRPE